MADGRFFTFVVVTSIRKYLFACLVAAYLGSILGLPVYYHYCGGELEEVSYLVKPSGCCEDEGDEPDGCCSNETMVLVNAADFTSKHSESLSPLPMPAHTLPAHFGTLAVQRRVSVTVPRDFAEPQRAAIVRCAVLRI